MAEKRLSDVIRKCCLKDGASSYAAFKDLGTLQQEYPEVAEAIEREAELRTLMGGPKGVLEKIARPFLDAELEAQGQHVEADTSAQPE